MKMKFIVFIGLFSIFAMGCGTGEMWMFSQYAKLKDINYINSNCIGIHYIIKNPFDSDEHNNFYSSIDILGNTQIYKKEGIVEGPFTVDGIYEIIVRVSPNFIPGDTISVAYSGKVASFIVPLE
ncbi:MAG: hypothetical protein FWF29_11735 [Treponema sp.]|nr:hypothetical protein [Treponema sp.]